MYISFVIGLCVVSSNFGLQLSDSYENFSREMVNFTDFSEGKRHVIVSPFSIWNVMFGLMLGAGRENAHELLGSLKLTKEEEKSYMDNYKSFNDKILKENVCTADKKVSLKSVGCMLLNEDFQVKPEFDAIITYALGVKTKSLNFGNSTAALVAANNFILNSNGNLKGVLLAHDFEMVSTKMVLSFPISFKATWRFRFNVIDTAIEPFYDEKGEIIREVYMMRQRNKFPFTHIRELGAFVLDLPYGLDNKFSMLIILPSPDKTINEVYGGLGKFTLKDVFHKLNNDTELYGLENIDIRIPRFEIDKSEELNVLFENMGVKSIFQEELADFSRTTNESLFVFKINHRAEIEVTESSTTASALTSAVLIDHVYYLTDTSSTSAYKTMQSKPIYPPAFIANRPFIYFIMEKTTTSVLFGGAYSESRVF